MKHMRVGITGHSGFIGKNVSKAIHKEGYDVVLLDSAMALGRRHENARKDDADDLGWVLHFAASTSIEASLKDPFSTYANNVKLTMEAIRIANRSKAAFLYMSSYVYGKPEYLPVDEKHPVNPTNPYMGSKALGEEVCRQLSALLDFPLVILRGFTIYGDCGVRGRLISDLMQSVREGAPLEINDPIPKRDYLYIKDFNELIIKIISREPVACGTYNVGCGESNSNQEVAELILKLSGRKDAVRCKSIPRPNDIQDSYADISLIKAQFSWTPRYSLEQGLGELINEYSSGKKGVSV